MRYRFTFQGEPRGPWRDTEAEALNDAVAMGEAERDDFKSDRVILRPFAKIEKAGTASSKIS